MATNSIVLQTVHFRRKWNSGILVNIKDKNILGRAYGYRARVPASGTPLPFDTLRTHPVCYDTFSMNIFCFRLDVDTHVCVRGMENLLQLGSDNPRIRFTAFFNMGKAVSRRHSLSELFGKPGHPRTTPQLTSLQRIGWQGVAVAGLFNPFVASPHSDLLRRTRDQGHEVGLHGGTNHATWQREAGTWSEARIRREVEWGVSRLSDALAGPVSGFASPGWTTSPFLSAVLREFGFRYLADHHAPEAETLGFDGSHALYHVPTNMTGEPGGVGYIENLRARGLTDLQILDHFRSELKQRRLAVVYDHPGYLGIKALSLAREMFEIAGDLGFEILTMENAMVRIRQ